MGTKTISLAEDAYERLKAEKSDDESFSDVVRRLTTNVKLSEFHGAISEETATDLEAVIAEKRSRHADQRNNRTKRISESLDDS
jgi:predicted CopG family antitoxin